MLLRVKAKVFTETRDRKGLFEIFKRLTVEDDLLCKRFLNRDVDTSIGTKLMKSVKLRKKEVISLLLLRYTILGAPGRVPG